VSQSTQPTRLPSAARDSLDPGCAASAANRPQCLLFQAVPPSRRVSRSIDSPCDAAPAGGEGINAPAGAASASPTAFRDATEAQSFAERPAQTSLAGTRLGQNDLDSITDVVKPIKLKIACVETRRMLRVRPPGLACDWTRLGVAARSRPGRLGVRRRGPAGHSAGTISRVSYA
jgi:hypothetical protein